MTLPERSPLLPGKSTTRLPRRLEQPLDQLVKLESTNKAGLKLQRIVRHFRQNLFVVEPTNNRSEQTL
jgi:hypothetical protein